jgi:hypothetical protein
MARAKHLQLLIWPGGADFTAAFAALHESGNGTKLTIENVCSWSAIGVETDVICSL